MHHGKANELIGTSVVSFEEALERILQRANKTLRGIHTMDVVSKTVTIDDNGERKFHVRALLKFSMTAPDLLHL